MLILYDSTDKIWKERRMRSNFREREEGGRDRFWWNERGRECSKKCVGRVRRETHHVEKERRDERDGPGVRGEHSATAGGGVIRERDTSRLCSRRDERDTDSRTTTTELCTSYRTNEVTFKSRLVFLVRLPVSMSGMKRWSPCPSVLSCPSFIDHIVFIFITLFISCSLFGFTFNICLFIAFVWVTLSHSRQSKHTLARQFRTTSKCRGECGLEQTRSDNVRRTREYHQASANLWLWSADTTVTITLRQCYLLTVSYS